MNVPLEAGVLEVQVKCEMKGCLRQSQVFWFAHQGGALLKGWARSFCEEHAKLCTLAMEDDARRTGVSTIFFQKPIDKCFVPNCNNPPKVVTLLKLLTGVDAYFICEEHEDTNTETLKRFIKDLVEKGLGRGMMVEGDALRKKMTEEPDDGR